MHVLVHAQCCAVHVLYSTCTGHYAVYSINLLYKYILLYTIQCTVLYSVQHICELLHITVLDFFLTLHQEKGMYLKHNNKSEADRDVRP